MSWLKSAVIKAVEVGGQNNITRTVKSYAGTVVYHAGQAVTGGARIIQDRMGIRNSKSFKQTVKGLEDAAVSCRGIERVELLQRWLFALEEIERMHGNSVDHSLERSLSSEESYSTPRDVSLNLYFDSDMGVESMNFRDIFLYSQALEGITLSMILEAPDDEEVSLLLAIFGYCLTGGNEVHNAIMSSIQDMGKAFSNYQDEVLVKREELLQFAQGSISGLKLNADISRLEYEIKKLQRKVDEMEVLQVSSGQDHVGTSEKTTALVEVLKEALAEVYLCSRLEALLLRKKSIKNGESPDIHSQKACLIFLICWQVDKLKVLAESLANSSIKAEKRILDHRHQKEEALNFRIAKANEVTEFQKELLSEIAGLEKQREGLEAELKKVNVSLASAFARLKRTREERDQFDEASNQIVMHLKAKEDELAKSVASCKVEADIVHIWINFLEDTWQLQSSYTELKNKQISDDLEKYGNCFLKLIKYHLSSCKDELKFSIAHISTYVDNLKQFNDRSDSTQNSNNDTSKDSNSKKYLEEEYLATETKIVTAFHVADHMRGLFYSERETGSRRDDPEVEELFESIEKLRVDFESIERPILEIEILKETQSDERLQKGPLPAAQITASSPRPMGVEWTAGRSSDTESEIAKLEMEYGKAGMHCSTDEIGGWEFDDLDD
ncbi:unnamed protein product [Musa textilis]